MTIYLMTVEGHYPGERWSFGCHFNGPSASAADGLTAWQAGLTALWTHDPGLGNTLQSHISTVVGSDDAAVAELDPSTGKQVTKVMGAATHSGTNVDEPLPPQIALAVSLRTNLATKEGRGRFYLPALAQGACIGGLVITAAVEASLEGSKAMMDVMISAGFTPMVFHRTAVDATLVVRLDVGNVFDTQRRRRNKLVEARQSTVV